MVCTTLTWCHHYHYFIFESKNNLILWWKLFYIQKDELWDGWNDYDVGGVEDDKLDRI